MTTWWSRARVWVSPLIPYAKGLLLVFIGVLLIPIFNLNEFWVRVIGVLMEVLGLWTVLSEIRQTRTTFGLPGFFETFIAWVKRVPIPGRRRVITAEVHAAEMAISAASATARIAASEDADLEVKVRVLRENVDALYQLVSDLRDKMRDLDNRAKKDLREETRKLGAELEKLEERLNLVHTGGLDISFLGVIYVFAGMVLETFPTEIASLL